MKKEIERLVKDPHNKTVLYELTEERKQRLMRISDEVIAILHQRCHTPREALIVVHFMQEGLEEIVGGKIGGFITTDEDVQS